jgi:hypothetical protein
MTFSGLSDILRVGVLRRKEDTNEPSSRHRFNLRGNDAGMDRRRPTHAHSALVVLEISFTIIFSFSRRSIRETGAKNSSCAF